MCILYPAKNYFFVSFPALSLVQFKLKWTISRLGEIFLSESNFRPSTNLTQRQITFVPTVSGVTRYSVRCVSLGIYVFNRIERYVRELRHEADISHMCITKRNSFMLTGFWNSLTVRYINTSRKRDCIAFNWTSILNNCDKLRIHNQTCLAV